MFRHETTLSNARTAGHSLASPAPRLMRISVLAPALALLFPALPATTLATLAPVDLRCENLESPLGVDSEKPRLSWRLVSPERGATQAACEILAASSAERLARNTADLWISGRINSPETLNIPYNGRPLATSQQVFWKVRVWSADPDAPPSPWSATATFTTGILDTPLGPGWQPGAQWITSPNLLKLERKALGFCSREAKNRYSIKWVQLDLGSPRRIDAVILRAVQLASPARYGFPVRFKIEASDDPAFKKLLRIRTIADETDYDISAWADTVARNVPPSRPVTARYLRVTATKLRANEGGKPVFALGQIEVLSGAGADSKNIALNAPVTASDTSDDTAHWLPEALTDGLDTPASNPLANSTLLLRREFTIRPGLTRALAHVTGLGHYEFAVNSSIITAGHLTPGWTNPDKTILYDTYDITPHLRPGQNVLAITLAGGFHNIQPDSQNRYHKFATPFRPLLAHGQIRLEFDDGLVETINTDTSWRAAPGPATYASIYGGEDYDARLEPRDWALPGFDDTAWLPAVPAASNPAGKFRGATSATPPFIHHETLQPVSKNQIHPGLAVLDFGRNAPILPALRVRGPPGAVVRITPAELVDATGAIDRASSGGGGAFWQYTLLGNPFGETWTPEFFYHGARYLQAELFPAPEEPGAPPRQPETPHQPRLPLLEKIEAIVTHSDTPAAGDFACSDEQLNRIRDLVRWAQRGSLAHVITDTPHRDRAGHLASYHLNGPALRYEWNLDRLFAKTFRDMADSQLPSGLIPDDAPDHSTFILSRHDSPECGAALILAAWQHYLWTADDAPLRTHFRAMDDYLDYLAARAKKHILDQGQGDTPDTAPRPARPARFSRPFSTPFQPFTPAPFPPTPIALTDTALHYEATQTLARIATVIGRGDDASRLSKEASKIAEAFNQAFLDVDAGIAAAKKRPKPPRAAGSIPEPAARYAAGSQTAQAIPLALGLVPAEHRAAVLDSLLEQIRIDSGSIAAGGIGCRYLFRALAGAGRPDLVYELATQTGSPGYAQQLAQGATSLAETWDARRTASQNHIRLGQITEWLYGELAGLQPDPDGPGFRKIIINPQPTGGVTWARASHESPRGPISCAWKIDAAAGTFTLEITIPAGSTATVHMPAKNPATVREGAVPAALAKGVRPQPQPAGGDSGGRVIYTVESGQYVFTAEY